MDSNHLSDEHTQSEILRLREVEQELRERLRQQAAIAYLGQRALLGEDLNSLLDEITRVTIETLQVEFCKILELLPGGEQMLLRSGAGWQEGLVGQALVESGQGSQAGYTLATEGPVIVPDLAAESRFTPSQLLVDHGIVSGLSVQIPGKKRPFGVLGVHTRRAEIFSADDINFLQAVANTAAWAVNRFQTEADLRSSRDQLAIILGGVADGITAQDPSGRLIYSNQAAAQITGYTSEQELLETPITEVMNRFQILDDAGQPIPLEQLPGRMAIRDKQSHTAALRFRRQGTQGEHWSILKATPMLDTSGEVELVVNIFHDITEIKRIENNHRFLAAAGELLASSLDYETTLENLAGLAVNQLADWCSVYVVEEGSAPRQIAVAHVDPQKVDLARQLQSRYPPDWEAPAGLPNVLRTGQAEYYPELTNEMLEKGARDEEHQELIRSLGLRSAMILPLVARGRVLGAITLIWADSGRTYSENDLLLAEELARRAATAVDNAWLYQQAQTLNAELEARVSRRTSQLQLLINELHKEASERQKAEQALRQNEQLLHGLFESAPDATALVDRDGKIVQANAQMEALFQYVRSDLLGKAIDDLLLDQFRAAHAGRRQGFFDAPRTRPMGAGLDLVGRRKDGSEIPIDILLSPVHIQSDTLVIAAIRDISQRKQMESDLHEIQRRLIESVEAERLHLAQELHDGPMQDLYAVVYQLQALDGEINSESPIAFARETIQKVIETLRATCGVLRPPTLAPFGLQKAILAHIEPVQAAHPEIQIETDLMPDGQALPERVRLALYRIYQHAVSNTIRHARASRLKIHFSFDEQQICLRIEDNGCGFEPPARWVELARGGHLGLVGTAERVKSIGGQLSVISAPGQGVQIEVTAPFRLESQTARR